MFSVLFDRAHLEAWTGRDAYLGYGRDIQPSSSASTTSSTTSAIATSA
jgi:hypothetical protein